ncbi:MAG: hypothetical protein R3Y59_02885 [bacterium]
MNEIILKEKATEEWQQRLIEEIEQLQVRVQQLHATLTTDVPSETLSPVDITLLNQQMHHMVEYLKVLGTRLRKAGLVGPAPAVKADSPKQ